jgi:hypothetical protein
MGKYFFIMVLEQIATPKMINLDTLSYTIHKNEQIMGHRTE